eukprot:6734701-Karenia_brevis.AAC.1
MEKPERFEMLAAWMPEHALAVIAPFAAEHPICSAMRPETFNKAAAKFPGCSEAVARALNGLLK